MLLLLLLSRFSHVRLYVTPETAAHQAPPSLGFSRQEHWSGLPFPSPMHESEKWKWTHSVVSDSSRPHGLQPPGSSIHGIISQVKKDWVIKGITCSFCTLKNLFCSTINKSGKFSTVLKFQCDPMLSLRCISQTYMWYNPPPYSVYSEDCHCYLVKGIESLTQESLMNMYQ